MVDRQFEAALVTMGQAGRKLRFVDLFEDPFLAAAADLHAGRHSGGQFQQSNVQQRRTNFQTESHAGPVDFGEEIVGQQDFCIGGQHPAERVARTAAERLLDDGLRSVIAQQSGE